MTGKTKIIGTRAQVWHGTCKKTSGGLTKSDLMMNKHGHIVSRAKHNTAKKEKRLLKHGYGTKKGKFGYVKVGSRKMRKSMKGGYTNLAFSPSDVNSSYMISDVVPQKFSPLDMALDGGSRRRKSRGRNMRGGYMTALAPADFSSTDITGQGPNATALLAEGAGIAGQNITVGLGESGPQVSALGAAGGGRHRRRGRKMRGGTTTRYGVGQGGLDDMGNVGVSGLGLSP
jgi:hypothetical protein